MVILNKSEFDMLVNKKIYFLTLSCTVILFHEKSAALRN